MEFLGSVRKPPVEILLYEIVIVKVRIDRTDFVDLFFMVLR